MSTGKYLKNLFSLEGRCAIVTGGARGNGRAISEALLRAGSKVIICDILKTDLLTTADYFKKNKLKVIEYVCDLSDTEEIMRFMKFVNKVTKKVDILVNNAGVSFSSELKDYTDEKWDRTYRVNLLAPFILTREVSKLMIKQKSGVIINITGLNSEQAFPDNPAYVACKGGLKQLTKSLAMDLGQYNIRVNSIGPGYFKTNMTKKSWGDLVERARRTNRMILNRWGESEDLAGAVIFLSSDSSSYITGQDIYVDGGWLAKGL